MSNNEQFTFVKDESVTIKFDWIKAKYLRNLFHEQAQNGKNYYAYEMFMKLVLIVGDFHWECDCNIHEELYYDSYLWERELLEEY